SVLQHSRMLASAYLLASVNITRPIILKHLTDMRTLPPRRCMALGVLACSAMSSISRLSPLRHQPTIGTFASSMADGEEQFSYLLSYSQGMSALLLGAQRYR